ncbi:mannose-1-phosphate guanylyltransferase/mannose-6-phosphate isomerase [Enterobacter asburiae]|uniref:mannose-1-phosphate guanylyltransferase/mannose-6-phosphate isomerase n=1 Tax=Enterobacter asburiae TaxID=61645 RepID=UPI0020057450|nr:mannose-1-phosphate guanylyltransferase/mannose-6-phosphate isomerase [Enterobacter asburiae]MCK7228289.1 mannose-1-phosphate guanylyltransferase/mannose-6-phosphate isomerase [Enterobacter asburiae]
MILPVIMAGGVGSRLWPLSREHHPKQFLHLHGQGTMLQNTVSRLDGLPVSSPLVICGEKHRFLVAEQFRLAGRKPASILCEPVARSTAPAVALAALQCVTDDIDPVLLVLAADHVIDDEPMFRLAVERALPLALQGKLVTFGIVPTGPETGYGYIERGEAVGPYTEMFNVACFVEKPDRSRAQAFIDTGRYYWNSGMFMFRASRYLEELKRFRPDILQACQQATEKSKKAYSAEFISVDRGSFSACPSESLDCAVMEKTTDAVVVSLDAGWSDVGAWDAVWQMSNKDKNNNAISGDVVIRGASGCYVRSEGRRIAVIGADDLIIVDTSDAVLVAGKQHAQHVKSLSENLAADFSEKQPDTSFEESSERIKDYRFESLTLNPGEKVLRQLHPGSAYYNIILSGNAWIVMGNNTQILSATQSTMITCEKEFTIKNNGVHRLELLEVFFYNNGAIQE